MTISTSENSQLVAGTGSTYAFDFSFIGASTSFISVTYVDVNGNQSVISPAQYAITLTAPGPNQLWGVGGVLTYPLTGAAIAIGTYLLIQRTLPFTQETTVRNQGNYYANVTEKALDTLEMQVQQVEAQVQRSIQIPAADAQGTNVLLPSAQFRAGKALVFDNSGNVTVGPASGGGGGTVLPPPGPAGNLLTSNGTTWESDPLTLTPATSGFLWPAYIYPSGAGLTLYTTFINLMATYPNVPVIAIQSPAPTGGANSDYTTSITNLKNAGASVVCYQDTNYGAIDIATVETNISNLKTYYPNIDGIFLDRRDQTSATEGYYAALQSYANGLGLYLVMGAPPHGQPFTPGDVFVVWENTDGGYPSIAQLSYEGDGVRSRSAVLLANDAYDAAQFALMTSYCAWVWLSDAPPDNAYGLLPTYLATLFQVLSAQTTASSINGVLPVSNGGTGVDTIPLNNLLVGEGTQPVSTIAPSTSGNVITDTGTTFISAPPIGVGNYLAVGMLIPAYVYPSPTTYFDTLLAAGASNPNVPMIFALTPAFTGGADANYTSIIATIKAAGYRVVLVVDVVNGTLALATAKARCATLQGYYPAADGIIMVGMPNTLGAPLTYTQNLYAYIRTTLGMSLVVGDPGAETPVQYFDGTCADIIVVSSDTGSWPPENHFNNNGVGAKSQKSVLVDNVAYSATSFALAAESAAWVYATDVALPGTPTYLNTMFAVLTALDLPPNLTIPAYSLVGNPKSYPAVSAPITSFYVDLYGHIISSVTGTPGIAAGTGAGTSPTVSVVGNDVTGVVNVTTGSGSPATAATVATITFAKAYAATPKTVILTPANALTAALTTAEPFPASIGTTSWILKSSGVALSTATAYAWNYLVIG